jgi:protoheme IX farnesyltransferase
MAEALPRARARVAGDLLALTKPRVVLMVLITTVVGYYVGLTGGAEYGRLLALLIGTALAAGGTLALNQYWERDVDALMARTRTRPLPEGRLLPLEALLFGAALTVIGLGVLAIGAGWLAAVVVAATSCSTSSRTRRSRCARPSAHWSARVPGALPPVAGWTAARDDLGLGAWVLFGILFLWQLPHTLAIAQLYREDYARAGVQLLPVIDAQGRSTERQILSGTLALLAVSLLPTLIGLAGGIYFTGALVLGAGFVMLGAQQALAPSLSRARRVLLASLLYLPVLLALLAFDKA